LLWFSCAILFSVHEEYVLSRAYLNPILVHGDETSSSSLSSSSRVQTRGMCLENVLNRWLQGYRTSMWRMWQQWWLLRIRYEFLNCELPSKLMWKTYLSFGLIASFQVVVGFKLQATLEMHVRVLL
jgi:hypothetical protein